MTAALGLSDAAWIRPQQDRQFTYKCNIEGRSRTHCCRGKAGSITYSECLSVAFLISHAKRMRRIILYPWPVWLYHIFPLYLVGDTIFGINIKCVLWFSLQLLSETFLILRRIERDMITNVHTSLDEKFPLFLSYFNKKFCFLDRFSKMLTHQI
jgi:hypothetical protein